VYEQLTAADAALVDALQEYIPEVLHVTATPGLNLAVARHGEIIWEAAFGTADLATHRPMTPGTVTRGGSMSKLYTTTAVLQLIDQEVIGLFDPVSNHLPHLKIRNPLGDRPITVYDLLTFRSGLATDMTDCRLTPPEPLDHYLAESYADPMLQEYGRTIPRWGGKVGGACQYSNLGTATLGYLVEVTNPEGLAFSTYIRDYITEPLGMTHTRLPPAPDGRYVEDDVLEKLSVGYARFGHVRLRTPDLYCAPYPACGLLTVPSDHIRLLLAYGTGKSADSLQLRPATVRRMLSPHAPIGDVVPAGWWTGLGVMLANLGRADYHFGYSGAYNFGWWNDARVYPHLDLSIVVCSNQWDMVGWHDPSIAQASGLVCDFAASWLLGGESTRETDRCGGALHWKVSYFMGLFMVERLAGLLGLASSVDQELVEGMISEATRTGGVPFWDPAGFRAGALDMLHGEATLEGVTELLASDQSQLGVSEQRLAQMALGSTGHVPLPLSFWLHRPKATTR
jgi:CubicO group peptidase (beta-lactamase class C family)